MKTRYSLFCASSLLYALYRTYRLYTAIDWNTGFYTDDPVNHMMETLVLLSAVLMVPFLYRACRRHGLFADGMTYTPASKAVFVLAAVCLAAKTVLAFGGPLPQGIARIVLFYLGLCLGIATAFRFLWLVLKAGSSSMETDTILSCILPLYFAMEMLNRFFSTVVNPYDSTMCFSLFAMASLCITSMQWTHFLKEPTEDNQRRFLIANLIDLVLCLSWRLPTIFIYISEADIRMIATVAADAVCALAVSSAAYCAIGNND